MDVLHHAGLAFPKSLPNFSNFSRTTRLRSYVEKAAGARVSPAPLREVGEPFRIATRPGILTCRNAAQTGLTAGTVMERSHTPLSIWFWPLTSSPARRPACPPCSSNAAWLSRYETAFAFSTSSVRPWCGQPDRIGGRPGQHVEVDEHGRRTDARQAGVHHKVLVACAVEVRHRNRERAGHAKGRTLRRRVRLAVASNRSAEQLCGFVESAVEPGTLTLRTIGAATRVCGSAAMTITPSPNGRSRGCRRISANHPSRLLELEDLAQRRSSRRQREASASYLNEFAFRFNRRFYPFNAFARCSASPAKSTRRHSTSFIRTVAAPTSSGCMP